MSTTSHEEHAGRSAELQRLLDEAGDTSSSPVRRRPPPAPVPTPAEDRSIVSDRPAPVPNSTTPAAPADSPAPAEKRAAADSAAPVAHRDSAAPVAHRDAADDAAAARPAAVRTPASRFPLRSSPPTTFPRRNIPSADAATAGPPADTDPGDGLRRSALVHAPISGAGRNRARQGASGSSGRRAGRGVAPSTKTAVTRSLAGRWGPAGWTPAHLEQQPDDMYYLPQDAARRPAAQPARAVPVASADPPAESQRTVHPAQAGGSPPVPPTDHVRPADAARAADPARATAKPTGGVQQPSSTLPPSRPGQRRTLILAGGVAAAVVAIVAIVSIGNRSGSGPASDAGAKQSRVAMVQSTGSDGRPTVTTVTAPVSTVDGRVVALVADADGQMRQLTVVTAAPPATATRTAAPTTARPSSTSAPDSSSAVNGAGNGTPSTRTSATRTTRSTSPSAPSTSRTPSPAPADPGGEVATVVTGLTTLTGWEPITTN